MVTRSPKNLAEPPGTAQRRVGRPSNERFRALFTRNLSQLLDRRADVPREPAARAAELARVSGVTPAAARKWLTGAGWPTLEKLLELSQRYGFAPDDLLSEGPRQILDVSRLVDAEALRRAELGALTPIPEFGTVQPALTLALDPAALFDQSRSGPESGPSLPHALYVMPDESMNPHCDAGDRVVFCLDPTWSGDGLYLMQQLPGGPLVLRLILAVTGGYRIEAASPAFGDPPMLCHSLAANDAEALSGAPILRGRPVGLLRAFRSGAD